MALDVRLGRPGRRAALFAPPAQPKVRVRVPPVDTDEDLDGLRTARGFMVAILLGLGMWAVIGYVVFIIAN